MRRANDGRQGNNVDEQNRLSYRSTRELIPRGPPLKASQAVIDVHGFSDKRIESQVHSSQARSHPTAQMNKQARVGKCADERDGHEDIKGGELNRMIRDPMDRRRPRRILLSRRHAMHRGAMCEHRASLRRKQSRPE